MKTKLFLIIMLVASVAAISAVASVKLPALTTAILVFPIVLSVALLLFVLMKWRR